VREIAELTGIGKSRVATILVENDETVAPAPAPTVPPKRPPPGSPRKPPPAPTPAPAPTVPPKMPPPALPPVVGTTPIDAEGTPLEIARSLLESLVDSIMTLEADSPRLNQARAEARQNVKLIALLEREAASKETPEDVERRRRREDGETRREIEQYVAQAEREAEEQGLCVHCGQAIPPRAA
jgi:hypothetical protein